VNIKTGKGHIGGYAKDIDDLFYKIDRGNLIDERREDRTQKAQIIIIGKEAACKRPEMLFAIGDLLPQDNLGGIDAIGAGNLAPLALAAEPYPFINGGLFIRAKTFRIGAGLFRSGESGIDPEYGTALNTDCTSYAMLKIGFHYKSPSHIFAAPIPVAIAIP
jgi:hypothetical protein